jgi:hypothetical protein
VTPRSCGMMPFSGYLQPLNGPRQLPLGLVCWASNHLNVENGASLPPSQRERERERRVEILQDQPFGPLKQQRMSGQ